MEKKVKLSEVKMLYKYRYFDCNNYHIRTILYNEFYFASKEELNDPFDLSSRPLYEAGSIEQMMKHAKDFILNANGYSEFTKNEVLKENIELIKNDKNAYAKKAIDSFNKAISLVGLCSFSADIWSNILMWSHYCDSNKGFCIGLNLEKLYTHLQKINHYYITPFEVSYKENFVQINPFEKNDIEPYINALTHKYDIWKYENEVRLINFKANKLIFKVPEDVIDEIILGLYVSDVNKELVINALKLKQHKPKLYQIKQLDNSFELDREEIEY